MNKQELVNTYYVEPTCLEDYYNLRDRKTEQITYSGTMKQIKELIHEMLTSK